jgi:Fe-S-cluster containining protein
MELDCKACGACCVEAGPVTVRPETDVTVPARLTRSVRRCMGYASWEADFGVRQMATHLGGRCKALKGQVMKDCHCGIYERRPAVCRAFEPGSEGCLASRERAQHKAASEIRYRGYGADWQETVR